jgi:1-acyl-sn-glycerol-3-phosphate acyltransferase
MRIKASLVNWFLRGLFSILCKIDKEELKKIPREGPLILVGNHINFLEAPVVFPILDNPNVRGIAKVESWDNPLFNFLFNMWGIFPIERGTIDREAFRKSFEVLEKGQILAVSPEGTRSKDGLLLQGKPGIVALASRSKVPMLPVAFYGYENFWDNLKHLRRTEFHVVVGKPFSLVTTGTGFSKEARQAATDEIMYKVASLMPEKYHGYYQNPEKVEYKYITDIV